jgi:hypothetical protein
MSSRIRCAKEKDTSLYKKNPKLAQTPFPRNAKRIGPGRTIGEKNTRESFGYCDIDHIYYICGLDTMTTRHHRAVLPPFLIYSCIYCVCGMYMFTPTHSQAQTSQKNIYVFQGIYLCASRGERPLCFYRERILNMYLKSNLSLLSFKMIFCVRVPGAWRARRGQALH